MPAYANAQIKAKNSTKKIGNNIVGGRYQKKYLFHEFREFNIKNKLNFDTPRNTKNIILKVEGNSKSNLLGDISVNANKGRAINFIILNPNGIKLGRNFRTHYRGSLILSSASRFERDINNKLKLHFERKNQSIDIFSNNLFIASGNTLSLFGNGITISNSEISAFGSNVEIGSFRKGSILELNQVDNKIILTQKKQRNQLGNIKISNSRIISNNKALSEGSISLYGNNLSILNGSTLANDTRIIKKRIFPSIFKSKINLDFQGIVTLRNNSFITTRTDGIEDGSPISIHADSLRLIQGAKITSDSSLSSVDSGNSGNLDFNTGTSIFLRDHSEISSDSVGGGNGGNIDVRTKSLRIEDSSISSSKFEAGAGGRVFVDTANEVLLNGKTASLKAETKSVLGGDGGKVLIITDKLGVINGAKISTSITSPTSSKSLRRSEIDDDVGGVELEAREINILGRGSRITATSLNDKRAGNISLTSDKLLISNRGKIIVNALSSSAGGISIKSDQVLVNNQAGLSAITSSDTGNISIQNADTVILNNNSFIRTNAVNNANGGNIVIETNLLIGNDNSNILATAQKGTGGLVSIDSSKGIVGFRENEINSPLSNDIVVTSNLGLDGSIEFKSPIRDPAEGLSPDEPTLIDSAKLIQQACSKLATLNSNDNQFSVVNRGGLQSNSDNYLSSINHSNNWITATANNKKNQQRLFEKQNSEFHPVLEAHAWRYLPNGKISLFAETPTLGRPANCNQTALKYQY